MPPNATARQRMRLDEFLSWSPEGDARYELIAGVPLAMNPPRRAHGTLVATLARWLGEALDQQPPCVVVTEAGILSPTHADTWYQADLAVTCEPPRSDQPETPSPRLIIEVLSPSTEAHDRKVKLIDYRNIESVEEILLVDQDRPYCELHRRLSEGRWLVDLVNRLDAAVRLDCLDLELPLALLYRGVELARGAG